MTEGGAIRQLRALNARFIHNFVTNDVAAHAATTRRDDRAEIHHRRAAGRPDKNRVN